MFSYSNVKMEKVNILFFKEDEMFDNLYSLIQLGHVQQALSLEDVSVLLKKKNNLLIWLKSKYKCIDDVILVKSLTKS